MLQYILFMNGLAIWVKENNFNDKFDRLFLVKYLMQCFQFSYRYKLNIWDVGGQSSLRSYWRNYFECTDGLIWVVDSADGTRLRDCHQELRKLLLEEVRGSVLMHLHKTFFFFFFLKNKLLYCLLFTLSVNVLLWSLQRLAGATLLVLANKQDIPEALNSEQIRDVSCSAMLPIVLWYLLASYFLL